jgi:hypothetical protein
MAVYISIQKSSETAADAIYILELVDGQRGRVRIDKTSGEVSQIEALPGDELGQLYKRAVHKLRQHWEKGEFPDKTCWAS